MQAAAAAGIQLRRMDNTVGAGFHVCAEDTFCKPTVVPADDTDLSGTHGNHLWVKSKAQCHHCYMVSLCTRGEKVMRINLDARADSSGMPANYEYELDWPRHSLLFVNS